MHIDEYSFGHIVIDGKPIDHDVLIYDGEVHEWWREEGHKFQVQDFAGLPIESIKTIVLGNGHSGVAVVPQETIDFFEENGIEVIVAMTGEAVEEFNKLADQEGIAAGLHLTC